MTYTPQGIRKLDFSTITCDQSLLTELDVNLTGIRNHISSQLTFTLSGESINYTRDLFTADDKKKLLHDSSC